MATITEKNFQADLEAIRAVIASLNENIGKIAGEASKAQTAMAKTVGKAAKASVRAGAKMWDEAADLGHDTTEAVVDAACARISNIEKRIKQQPVSSLLLALGIGIVAGVIGLSFRK